MGQQLYERITRYGFAKCRKDLIYIDKDRNGMGMTSISDLYAVNRARIVSQIMEAALRQRGRGQVPWAEKVLMEEITKETPCLQIYKEIKEIMGELGLEPMRNGENYRLWTRQQRQLKMLSEQAKPIKQQGKFFSNITTNQAKVSWPGMSIPVHVFEWLKFWNKCSSMQQVTDFCVADPRMARIKKVKFNNISIREDVANKISRKWRAWPLEVVSNPYWRSLPNAVPWSLEKITQALQHTLPAWVLLNMTMPDNVELQELERLLRIIKQYNVPVVLLCNNPDILPALLHQHRVKLDVASCKFLQFETVPGSGRINNSKVCIASWSEEKFKEEYSNIWEVLFGDNRIVNNMYFYDPPHSKQWSCPACGEKGMSLNNRFGACNRNRYCRCISLEFEEHDTDSCNVRKPFSIHLNKNKHSKTTKTFYTDGSGTRLNRESDVMTTGWAAVEVESQRTVAHSDEHQLSYRIIRHSSDLSPCYESVQWCEARAILEAIKILAEPNCNIHIHTDSLGTMLRIQSMRYEAYRKNRQKKHKELTQDILEAAAQVNGTVIIEWVKAHEAEIPKDKDNWIRRLKSAGNDMADEEAKRVVQQGIVSSEEKCLKGPWVLYDKSADVPVDWMALPKAVLCCVKRNANKG